MAQKIVLCPNHNSRNDALWNGQLRRTGPGTLDPAVMIYLMRKDAMGAAEIEDYDVRGQIEHILGDFLVWSRHIRRGRSRW